MEMFENLLNIVISSGLVVTIVEVVKSIRNRHEDKKIKQAEATTADTEAQEKQMSLAEMYLEKVLALTETGNDNQRQMMEKLDTIDRRTDKQEIQIGNIEEYLNGNYHNWLAEKQKNGSNRYNQ